MASEYDDCARREYEEAKGSLAKEAPSQALVRFYSRHDGAIAEAIARAPVKPACRSGCSYCCYYKVEATAVEVLAIRQFVVSRFAPELIKRAIVQASRNAEEARDLTHAQHLATNQACPFLVNDACSVYPVRPAKCRSFHASEVEVCRKSYENPNDLELPNSYVPEVFVAANGTADAFGHAVTEAGFDGRTYDFNSAFLEAMQNASAQKRMNTRKRVFLKAKVVLSP